MKDYAEHLEKNRTRAKWITAGLVLLLFASLAYVYFQMKTDLNEKKAVTDTVIGVEEKTDSIAEMGRALNSLDTNYALLQAKYDSLVSMYAVTDSVAVEVIKTLTRFTEGIDGKTVSVIKENLGDNEKKRLMGLFTELKKNKPYIDNITIARKSDGKTSVFIIYMDSYAKRIPAAAQLIEKDNQFVVLKKEQMDKFSYNPTIKYFKDDEATRKAAEKIKAMFAGEGYDFEIQRVNLPAPDNNIEVWIGKDDKEKERMQIKKEIMQGVKIIDKNPRLRSKILKEQ